MEGIGQMGKDGKGILFLCNQLNFGGIPIQELREWLLDIDTPLRFSLSLKPNYHYQYQ
jgi:hypothetical protein